MFTDSQCVVQKPLGGGETVWKELVLRYAISIGITGYLPFTASAPLGEISPNAPSCTTVWWLEELKRRYLLKPVKIVHGMCICLQDTSLVDNSPSSQFPTM
jgi:hypothetical protein